MGLFEKNYCDLCGDKVNMLTRQKLSDGFLCSDCKHKLSALTDGWKNRTLDDVKRHLELREENKQKYNGFQCTATAGVRNNQLEADFNHGWFIFAIDNRDYKQGNPEVFEFSQLQDFWLEEGFRTEKDSDGDGIPDSRDNYDNGSRSNIGFNMHNNSSMVNVPLSAQPFVRRNNSYTSANQIKEVSSLRACFKVNHPYITREISFYIDSSIASGNGMELMNAYEMGVQVMQLCQQIKGQQMGGMQQGMAASGMYGQPMNQGMATNGMYGQPMNQNFGQQSMNQGFAQQPINQNFGQQQNQQIQGGFCPNCGAPKTPGAGFCPNCGAQIN